MKSLCIKINNNNILDYLQNEFKDYFPSNDLIISRKSFFHYNNLILHYIGGDISSFYTSLCNILLNMILKYYEASKLKELININYFYFSEFEKQAILEHCFSLLESDSFKRNECNNSIYLELLRYTNENKSLYIDGFINFRLYNYVKILDEIVDTSVNSYIIEREYNEFIDLLKIYVENKEPCVPLVHLIYMHGESILIDDDRNIITVDDNILNATYLSDISFSSNDYALNTLLCILPKKIIIHVIDGEDDFINTIKLVFGKRVTTCTDCNICSIYKNISSHILSNKK